MLNIVIEFGFLTFLNFCLQMVATTIVTTSNTFILHSPPAVSSNAVLSLTSSPPFLSLSSFSPHRAAEWLSISHSFSHFLLPILAPASSSSLRFLETRAHAIRYNLLHKLPMWNGHHGSHNLPPSTSALRV